MADGLRKVEAIANAVLYEGYMLYPYRASSVKNRHRFNWGVLAPEGDRNGDASEMRTECIVEFTKHATVTVKVRFLQLAERDVIRVGPDRQRHRLEQVEIDGELYQSWQEGIEREIELTSIQIGDAVSEKLTRNFAAERTATAIDDSTEIVRRSCDLSCDVALTITGTSPAKISFTVRNTTRPPSASSRDRSLSSSLISTHAILEIDVGKFISLMDPPDDYRDAAAGCENIGVFPVLAGEEGEGRYILASPIILYDYPQIADESAGDLFDGTEIDEILTLRVMTLTDEEKREARASDERVRKILDRTDAMTAEELLQMHGTLRGRERARSAEWTS